MPRWGTLGLVPPISPLKAVLGPVSPVRALVATLGALLWALAAVAAPPTVVQPDEVVLEDQIALEVIDRDIYAFDAQGTGRNHFRLELGEQVVSSGQRGRVAYVMTNRRALALASGAGGWRELKLRVGESADALTWLSARLFVVATAQRILGFDSGAARWIQVDVGPHEAVSHVEIGTSTAIVVTDRKAYGLSPESGGFFAQPLRIHEKLERVSASATLGQIRTDQRILIFRSPSGTWSVEKRPID